MPPLIVGEGVAKFSFGTTPTVVDVSCEAWALELSSETETIDVSTFCNPAATDMGKTTETAVLSLLWSEDLYTKLQPHVREEATFTYAPDANADTAVISFDTRIGGMPWGRFELGQRVEVDLALAVLTPITYTPAP